MQIRFGAPTRELSGIYQATTGLEERSRRVVFCNRKDSGQNRLNEKRSTTLSRRFDQIVSEHYCLVPDKSKVERFCTFGTNDGLIVPECMRLAPATDRHIIGLNRFNDEAILRIGPYRLNVRIARKLTGHGISSLRFDLAGMGGSPHSNDQHAFEVQAVIDLLPGKDASVFCHENDFRIIATPRCAEAETFFFAATRAPSTKRGDRFRLPGRLRLSRHTCRIAFPAPDSTHSRNHLCPMRRDDTYCAKSAVTIASDASPMQIFRWPEVIRR